MQIAKKNLWLLRETTATNADCSDEEEAVKIN